MGGDLALRAMMLAEIIGGMLFGSIALAADGMQMQKWHSCQGACETEWQEACRRETASGHRGQGSHAWTDVVVKDLGIRRSLIIANGPTI